MPHKAAASPSCLGTVGDGLTTVRHCTAEQYARELEASLPRPTPAPPFGDQIRHAPPPVRPGALLDLYQPDPLAGTLGGAVPLSPRDRALAAIGGSDALPWAALVAVLLAVLFAAYLLCRRRRDI